MKKLFIISFLLLFSHVFEGQIFNGWRHNEGNTPPSGPNLAIQGYGKNAVGADIGDPTITVTTTSGGQGIGTLYRALFVTNGGTGQPNSHKKIVFSVSGTITSNDYTIDDLHHVTIDGTGRTIVITAPANDGMSFENTGAHHIIVKNLNFRDSGGDGLNIVDGANNIAIVNCAFWLNHDGNIDIAKDSHDNTIQYCVIGNHTNECNCGSGGAGGMLITGFDNSIHHNLYNPGTSGNPDEGERLPFLHGNYGNASADIRNNIIYNYGRGNATGTGYGTGIGYDGPNEGSSDCGCYARANVVNNYYYTPSTAADQDGVDLTPDNNGRVGSAYSAGNISGNGFNFNTGAYTNHAEWPITGFEIDVETTCAGLQNVLDHVGPDVKHAEVLTFINGVTNLGSCTNYKVSPIFPSSIYDLKNLGRSSFKASYNFVLLDIAFYGRDRKRFINNKNKT